MAHPGHDRSRAAGRRTFSRGHRQAHPRLIAFIAHNEAYTIGQIGILRRFFGYIVRPGQPLRSQSIHSSVSKARPLLVSRITQVTDRALPHVWRRGPGIPLFERSPSLQGKHVRPFRGSARGRARERGVDVLITREGLECFKQRWLAGDALRSFGGRRRTRASILAGGSAPLPDVSGRASSSSATSAASGRAAAARRCEMNVLRSARRR